MRIGPRIVFALLAALVGATVGFAVPFAVVAGLAKCPPAVRTCDLPAMAGVGLGLLVAPIMALAAGLVTFWRLGPRRAGAQAV